MFRSWLNVRHSVRICCVLVMVFAPTLAWAQVPRRVTLGTPNASLREEFSGLVSMRELSTGRVILSDSREVRVVLADFATNSVTALGRIGSGPGEYERATTLFPLAGDSTLMPGTFGLRWSVIDSRGNVTTVPRDVVPFFRDHTQESVRGTDVLGRILTSQSLPRTPRAARVSSNLLLVNRATGKVDTIGRIDAGKMPRVLTAQEVDQSIDWIDAFPASDRYALSPDGWLVVVRLDPYRVDWRSADGRWLNGAAITERPIAMNEREKTAYHEIRSSERQGAPAVRVTGGAPGGTSSMAGGPPQSVQFNWDWPATIPPFMGRSNVLIVPQGEVVVQRTPHAGERTPVYDVFNRQGVREYQLTLAANQKLLGFGVGTVYVVTTDDVGLQRVSRHRWPIAVR